MIFPLLLQSSKCHDEMITEMSDELRVSLTEEVQKVALNSYVKELFANDLAPVVHKVDSAIHRINHCPLSMDSVLSGRQCYPTFEQPRPDYYCVFFSVSKMEAQIKKRKSQLSNEREMRHKSGKEVSKQPTKDFITTCLTCIWFVLFLYMVNSTTKDLEQVLSYYQQKCQDTEQQVRIL